MTGAGSDLVRPNELKLYCAECGIRTCALSLPVSWKR